MKCLVLGLVCDIISFDELNDFSHLVRKDININRLDDFLVSPCNEAFNSLGDLLLVLTVLLNGSKKAVKVDVPQGNYVILAQDGKADADGLGAYSGSYISAPATSATVLAEM